jgi:hypothetical protein
MNSGSSIKAYLAPAKQRAQTADGHQKGDEKELVIIVSESGLQGKSNMVTSCAQAVYDVD